MNSMESKAAEQHTAKAGKRYIMFNILLVAAAFVITMVCVVTGAYIQEGYLVSVGGVSPKKFRAPMTIENSVATERNRQAAYEASIKLAPITEQDETVKVALMTALDGFFEEATELRRQNTPLFTPYTAEENQEEAEVPKLPGISESNTRIILDMDTYRYQSFVDAVYAVADNVMSNGIQELDTKSLLYVKDEMDKLDLNSETRNLGYEIITLFLRPNVIVNAEATESARAERAERYETVYYLNGQTIVDEGQIISAEVYAVLDELGLVKSNYADNLVPIFGAGAVVILIFALVLMYIFFFSRPMVSDTRETLFVFALYTIMVIAARSMADLPYQFLPLIMFNILVATLIGPRLASVMNTGLVIIAFMIMRGEMDFLIFHLLSGISMALIAYYTTDKNKIIFATIVGCLMNLTLFAGVELLIQKQYTVELLYNSVYAAMAGMLYVIISFGSLPMWEAALGLVTPIKLMGLTNPDSHLLRRLAIEAPGTYHHSVIVANLAETAAYDIGADTNIARTGGYYHDIGKLKYPQYFVENMLGGANIHDDMDSFSSAQVIFSHVSHGLELADANKLPKIIRDIIAEHHGTSLLTFFYYKAQKESPTEEVEDKDYRYNYRVPQSREAAVVMLADTVEAAVRSMIPSGKTMDQVSEFITELIRSKLDDGQLMDSKLTIKDLDTIVKSFMRVFRGMYHERIPYPKVEKAGKKKAAEEKTSEA